MVSGLLGLTLAVSLMGWALAAEPEAAGTAAAAKQETVKPAGEFSQWFPDMGIDPADPKASETVLAGMGTVIRQSKTVNGETVILNGAVWEGDDLKLSLVMKGKNFPEDLTPGSLLAATLYTEECGLELPEEQWKEYVKKDVEQKAGADDTEAQIKERIQKQLDMGQKLYEVYNNRLYLRLVKREGDTLTFQTSMTLKNYLEKPELTLHIENVADYEGGMGLVSWDGDKRIGPGPGKTMLKGPFDFTFTPEKPAQPLNYQGSAPATVKKTPLRITSASVSPTRISVEYALDKELDMRLEGVWTKDGKYVACSGFVIQGMMTSPGGKPITGHLNRDFPYPIDPATVTALDISGTRVELGKLNLASK